MINLIKNQKTVDKILLSLAVLCLVMILLLSSNGFYTGSDDFSFMLDIKKNGLIQNCINGYNNWDGRYLTLGAFVQGFILTKFPIELVIFIWSLCFLSSGLLMFSIINFDLEFDNINTTKKIFLSILLANVFWFGSIKHLAETVYWGTGGVYSFNLLIGAIWIFYFLKIQKIKTNLIQKTGFVFFSIIAGATTQNLSIALITLVLITVIIDFLNQFKKKNIFNFVILISLIIGFLIIVLAAGNVLRFNEVYKFGKPNFSFFDYVINYFRILYKYIKWGAILMFFSVLSSIAISFFINPLKKIKFKLINFKSKQTYIQLLNDSKWLLVGFSTITPFIVVPGVVSFRTSIYFMFFLMLFIISFVYKMTAINTNKIFEAKKNKMASNLIFSALLTLTMLFVCYSFNKSFQLKKAVNERETILKNGKNKTVYVKLLDPNLNSFCFVYNDYYNDAVETPYYIIKDQERFYQTKIIVIK